MFCSCSHLSSRSYRLKCTNTDDPHHAKSTEKQRKERSELQSLVAAFRAPESWPLMFPFLRTGRATRVTGHGITCHLFMRRMGSARHYVQTVATYWERIVTGAASVYAKQVGHLARELAVKWLQLQCGPEADALCLRPDNNMHIRSVILMSFSRVNHVHCAISVELAGLKHSPKLMV